MSTQDATRILILEDNEDMMRAIEELLSDEGYQVDACSRGEQAVELARENHYDLVVADVRLPGIDGLSALSRVQCYQPDVGSLVVSGYSEQMRTPRANRLGLGGYLPKPFGLAQLLETVHNLLARRRTEVAQRDRRESLLSCCAFTTRGLAHSLNPEYLELLASVDHLAGSLGVEAATLEELRLAALLAVTDAEHRPPGEWPASSSRHLRYLEECWNGSGPQGLKGAEIPLEARILSTALHAFRNPKPPSAGMLDPALVEALRSVERTNAQADRVQLGLLRLGQTLMETGDLSGARRAFQEVVEERVGSPEGVRASLALARLERHEGDLERASLLAQRVPVLAAECGPFLSAFANLESAILLAELGASEAAVSLADEGERVCRELGLGVRAAACTLASLHFQGCTITTEKQSECLDLLLEPTSRNELLESLGWLLPLLWESVVNQPELNRQLGRLVIQFPNAQAGIANNLSEGARLSVVEFFESSDQDCPATLLETLSADSAPQIRQRAMAIANRGVGEGAPPLLTIRTLGRFEVFLGRSAVPLSAWKTNKVRHLFAFLAHRGERPSTEERVLDQFWPDNLERGRRNLYTSTSSMRAALRVPGEKADWILRSAAGLQLNSQLEIWHDLSELRRANDLARAAAEPKVAAKHHRTVLSLYLGTYLEDCYMDWADEVRRETERAVVEAADALTEWAASQELHSQVIEHGLQGLGVDRCHQELHARVMEAQLALGRPEAAVRQYEECKSSLAQLLQLEPSIKLERLHQKARLWL